MIEILFHEGEAAAMKVAKSMATKHTISIKTVNGSDGPTSVWSVGKKKLTKKEFSRWLPGTSEEVVCLGLMLDIGDIKEPLDNQCRIDRIYSLYSQARGTAAYTDTDFRRIADESANEMARLKEYLEKGEAIRIWFSDAPYSRCGFYSLCAMLQKYENEIHTIKLPEYSVRTNSIVMHKDWGEVAAEEFAAFLPCEKKLSKEEIRMYAIWWRELVEDNSPLRAMVSGRLVGVREDFYDFAIWKKLTKEPVKEARLIGNILGNYPISVSDWWYAARIEHFIGQGKIKIAEDSEDAYARMICLA
ncbi:MAG: DUF1835 domain-containing protein [Lachnospiraceae bacterium]|nr:DUF1835 domain-containing protein [Lachnospiraceae bacterium]